MKKMNFIKVSAIFIIAILFTNFVYSQKDWEIMVKDYTEFTNILDLKKWDSQKAKDYGVTAIPSYFLLDKNKVIVAKPNDVEELKEMFQPR